MMQVALGVLGWRPAEFWAATPSELSAAVDGWSEAHGVCKSVEFTRDDLDDLMAKYPSEKK